MMNNPENQIVSRPIGGLWVLLWLALIFCALSALLTFFDPPTNGQLWQTWFLFGVPGTFAVSVTPYLLRHRIVADENGLRWRGALSGWKRARWDEISDFYLDSALSKRPNNVVETPKGNVAFDQDHSAHQELGALIAACARHAPYREWGVKGLRPDETFSLTFVTRELSWLALGSAFVPLTLVALALLRWVWNAPWQNFQQARALSGDGVAALAYLLPWLFTALFVCGMLSIVLTPWVSALILRERVTVTQDGLRFERRWRSLFIAWSELRAVHLHRERARFVGTRSQWQMHWLLVLRPFIERYAPDAKFDSENDGLDLAPPLRLASGALFYGFRTTALRLLLKITLPFLLTVAVSPFLMLMATAPDTAPRDDPRVMWFFAAPIALFCLYIWRLYARGGIALGESGIEVRGAWRDLFYRWEEIVEQDGKFAARRGEKLVKLWPWVPPVRTDELRAEVARRVKQK